MKIIVNAVGARAGAGVTHLEPFIHGLAAQMVTADFYVYVSSDFSAYCDHDRITWITLSIPGGSSFKRLIWDLIALPMRSRGASVVLSPLNFGPLWAPAPNVILQRNALYFDREYRRTSKGTTRILLAAYRLISIAESNFAFAVFVPSEAMAEHLRARMVRKNRLFVVGHGIDAQAARASAEAPPIERARAWLAADKRVLHVGTPSLHKGLVVLVRTLAELRRLAPSQKVCLAVTFLPDRANDAVAAMLDEASRLNVTESIEFLGPVAHEQVFPLYRAADVFLFPSLVESFGNPLLEAFSVGTPVVASDIKSIREVAGGRALLHRVNDHSRAARLAVQAWENDDASQREDRMRYADLRPANREAEAVAEVLLRAASSRARE